MSRYNENGQPPAKRRRLSPTPSDSGVSTNGAEAVSTARPTEDFRGYSDFEDGYEESSDRDKGEVTGEIAWASEDGELAGQDEEDEDDEQDELEEGGGIFIHGTSEDASPLNATPSQPPPPPRSTATQPSSAKSSPFQLQVEGLLRQTSPDYIRFQEPASTCLRQIKETIEGLPEQPPVPLAEAEKRLLRSSKIAIPFPHPRPSNDVKYKFGFSKPESINVVGSYALKAATKSEGPIAVDLIVHMPASLFESKDYLNYRYFHKRAHYLASIAAGLQRSQGMGLDLCFCSHSDNTLLPMVTARPSTSSDFTVQIIPALATDLFPPEKTLPSRNCVRTSNDEGTLQPPTPFYNASLRSNCTVNGFLKLLHSTNTRCPGFRDACMLGRTWLQRRGLTSSIAKGGFGNFEWATVMALLMETGGVKNKPVLAPSYSPIQLFGTTIHFLASRDLLKTPLATGASQSPIMSGVPTFFDSIHGINVLYKMTASSYQTLREEARTTARLFGGASASRFESLFLTKVAQPLLQFDTVFEVPHPATPSHTRPHAMENIHNIVSHGLGDRASQVRILDEGIAPWPLDTIPPRQKQPIGVGIVLDPVNSLRSVDRGPSAEDVEATEDFRKFWGEKAELRRFKDGSIQESLVWSSISAIAITKEIVLYLVDRHLRQKAKEGCRAVANDFLGLLTSANFTEDQAEAQRVNAAYTVLESTIRGFEGLPLTVRQIQPCGVPMRHTHLSFPSVAQASPHPVDVLIQFEGSSRWPDDLNAIQMTKVAFLLKLSELISQTETVGSSRLGLEMGRADIVNKAYLDIHAARGTAQKTVFRLRIHHTPEASLLERRLADNTLSPAARSDTAVSCSEYKRTFLGSPLHTQVIAKLSTMHVAYPPTARLLKIWLNAQHLGNHFNDELSELLAARVFLHPEPWSIPASAQTGFLRTLAFLAQWDWQADPLILDFSGTMKTTEVKDIRTKFEAWREVDPVMNRVALFVGNNYDTDGVSWTEYAPSKVVAARMSALARAAHKLVGEKGLELQLGNLFKPSTKGYDFVIRLQKAKKKATDAGKTKYKNLQMPGASAASMAGFDAADLYLDELQRVYGDAALFFCNKVEKDVIAGLWSPPTARRRWKVNLGWSTVPVFGVSQSDGDEDEDEEGQGAEVSINTDAMLAEMARLGGDLVRSVEAQR